MPYVSSMVRTEWDITTRQHNGKQEGIKKYTVRVKLNSSGRFLSNTTEKMYLYTI